MLNAKIVIKNKFWVVENDGEQIATILAASDGTDGLVFIKGENREKFENFKSLSQKYNIGVSKHVPRVNSPTGTVYGFPCDSKPFNPIYNLRRRLPMYTKSIKSKSYYCAGYYQVKYDSEWITEFCPKQILLARNEYVGPFKTVADIKKVCLLSN